MKIGSLNIDPPVALAPMAGLTDAAFRAVCTRFGCPVSLTEVINAPGIVHGSGRTMHMLECLEPRGPIGAHIYGRDPDIMAGAARAIEELERFDFIDINAGCPVRKIVAKGAGVALMRDPAHLRDVVAAVSSAVSLPVTVKTRLGLTPERMNISEVAQAVEEGGGRAIFIHARFASERHGGPADWEALRCIKQGCSIPVIGNGGLVAAEDSVRAMRRSGLDGVMIGRAALGNPWVFEEIRCLWSGAAYTSPSSEACRETIVTHLETLQHLTELQVKYRRRRNLPFGAEHLAVRLFRPHLRAYLSRYPGWHAARRRLNALSSFQDVLEVVDTVLS